MYERIICSAYIPPSCLFADYAEIFGMVLSDMNAHCTWMCWITPLSTPLPAYKNNIRCRYVNTCDYTVQSSIIDTLRGNGITYDYVFKHWTNCVERMMYSILRTWEMHSAGGLWFLLTVLIATWYLSNKYTFDTESKYIENVHFSYHLFFYQLHIDACLSFTKSLYVHEIFKFTVFGPYFLHIWCSCSIFLNTLMLAQVRVYAQLCAVE